MRTKTSLWTSFAEGDKTIRSLAVLDEELEAGRIASRDARRMKRLLEVIAQHFRQVEELDCDPVFMVHLADLVRFDLLTRSMKTIENEVVKSCINSFIHTRHKRILDLGMPGQRDRHRQRDLRKTQRKKNEQ